MYAIETKDLTKKYKDTVAVDKISFCVNDGELVSLLGVNGAGKTTTVKMLSCLSSQTSGEAWIFGKSITAEKNEVKKIIGVSPQETAVAPTLTVRENLDFLAGIYGMDKEKREKRISELVEEFDFSSILDKKAKHLSGGWQRRLSIAMALISEPSVLFLDEPTLGLDVVARSELWDFIRALKGKITILLTTHYMEEAEKLSDRCAIMKSGRLVFFDTPAALCQETGCNRFEDAFISVVKEQKK